MNEVHNTVLGCLLFDHTEAYVPGFRNQCGDLVKKHWVAHMLLKESEVCLHKHIYSQPNLSEVIRLLRGHGTSGRRQWEEANVCRTDISSVNCCVRLGSFIQVSFFLALSLVLRWPFADWLDYRQRLAKRDPQEWELSQILLGSVKNNLESA